MKEAAPRKFRYFTVNEDFKEGMWRPAVDIYKGPTGWLVKVDLAGVKPEDVRVECRGRHLTIEGSRRDSLVREGYCQYSMEISYNRFERSIELPCESSEVTGMEYQYGEGMLLVHLKTQRKEGTTK